MSQSNIIDFNSSIAVIDLIDTASRYAKQAHAALEALIGNIEPNEYKKLSAETKFFVLLAVTDRLTDLESLFKEWHHSHLKDLSKEASKYAGQAKHIIIAYQSSGLIDTISNEVLSNTLWLVLDRIEDILKLTTQIKVS